MNKPEDFHGLMAATVTPFDGRGNVDEYRIPEMLAWEKERGVDGFFVCGTTGEGLSMTVAERKRVAERSVEASGGLPVVVHVGANALGDAEELARHAAGIGARSISAAPPNFFRPGLEEAVACSRLIAGAAPDLPFYYYHIPSMSGVAFPVGDFVERALKAIPNFAGIKFTHEDLDEFGDCVKRFEGRIQLLFGRDELLLDSLGRGALGAVGSTYNYASPIFRKLLAAHAGDDQEEAKLWQQRACDFIRILVKHGGVRATKMFMTVCGMDCGNNRLPVSSFGQQEVDALKAELETMGYFEWNTVS